MLSTTNVAHANAALAALAVWSRHEGIPTVSNVGAAEAAERDYRRRLGKAIVQLRELAGVSQAWLAESVGRSEAAVSRWENGKSTPSAYDIRRLMEIFEAPADLLLDPPDVPVSPVAKLLEERAAAGVRKGRSQP